MKEEAQQIRDEQQRHDRFEVDLSNRLVTLFRRWPMLCGFSVRDAAALSRDGFALEDISELFVTEVSVYPLSGLRAPEELCLEIVAALVELIDESPEVGELLRERTFARVLH